jgi:NTE family protein
MTSPLTPVRNRYRDCFVLSGGGAAGAWQVGALSALCEHGVRPDLVVGCSVGALNAAFLAVDPSVARATELMQVWRALRREDVFGAGRASAARHILRRQDHLYEPAALQALIRRLVPLADLSQTAVPVEVVTTDLLQGLPAWHRTGDPVTVLSASACLPALFPPVALAGGLHVDGGVTCPVPVGRAVELGARRIWVLDVSADAAGAAAGRMSALDVLLRSFAISRAHLDQGVERRRSPRARTPEVVRLPRPDVAVDLRDFSRSPYLMQAGYAATRQALQAMTAAA